MRILAFETSAKASSVALLEGDKLLAEQYQNTDLTHSQTLLVMAQQVLQGCGMTTQDIQAVAVAAGPGSFTGVRIGVAAAKGFAWGGEIPCYGVSTLEAMAFQAGIYEGHVACCMDARREQVYHALFRAEGGTLTRICQDRAIGLEELGRELKELREPVFFVGDGSVLSYEALKDQISKPILLPEHLRQQRAAGVALAARKMALAGDPGDAETLTPNYLRLSQAERERLARLEKEKNPGTIRTE